MLELSKYYEVYILTASPNPRADKDKIKWLKKYLPFNDETAMLVKNAGATNLVAGSYVFKADDRKVAIEKLKKFNKI